MAVMWYNSIKFRFLRTNMKKAIIIGCPGSGKSTFAAALHEKTGLPLHHLDMMFWNSDKTTVEREVFRERLCAVLGGDEWIIDGNYGSTMELRLAACDTVFFLDYPTDVCLDGVRKRLGKARPDMPWIETEEDIEFTEYIKSFNEQQRPQILELLKKYSDKSIVVFKSREQAEEFINSKKHLMYCQVFCILFTGQP